MALNALSVGVSVVKGVEGRDTYEFDKGLKTGAREVGGLGRAATNAAESAGGLSQPKQKWPAWGICDRCLSPQSLARRTPICVRPRATFSLPSRLSKQPLEFRLHLEDKGASRVLRDEDIVAFLKHA
jgi:hypothetical protein